VLKDLLRAKGFSLLSMFPRCPVLTSLAMMVRRLTGEGKLRWEGNGGAMDWWQFQHAYAVDLDRIALGISESSRVVMERVFGVGRSAQLAMEQYFNSMDRIQHLDHPVILRLMKPIWADYYNSFVYHYSAEDPDIFPG